MLAAVGVRLDEAVSLAQAVMGLNGASGAVGAVGALSSSGAGPAAVVPLHAHTAAPVTAPEPALSPFRQELESSDDDSPELGRFRRGARALVRKTADVRDQVKDSVDTNAKIVAAIDPPVNETYAIVQHPSHTPHIIAPAHAAPDVGTTFGTSVVLAVVAGEAFSRRMRRKRE